jgi:molecular chaperone DnaK (HSP70)
MWYVVDLSNSISLICRLDGIPPAPRGVPQIEVKFDIDGKCELL